MKIRFTCNSVLVIVSAILLVSATACWSKPAKATPTILVSDIGDDIDDTWALGLILKSPELDLKLAVGDYGKAEYRARLLAKILQSTGRSDVAVGVGLDIDPRGDGAQSPWLGDYKLQDYPGKVYKDGVQAIIDTIMKSPVPVTVIAIGPAPNVAAALEREPKIAQHCKVVGMFGSVRIGYDGVKKPMPEWNVKADPKACQKVFTGDWDITITPLDTCGLVVLDGDRYKKVFDSKDPVASVVIQNYRVWSKNNDTSLNKSSVLFDTVAVYLAIQQNFCTMENLGIKVTDNGMTVIDDKAKKIHTATAWKNLDGYRDFLVDRLTTPIKH